MEATHALFTQKNLQSVQQDSNFVHPYLLKTARVAKLNEKSRR